MWPFFESEPATLQHLTPLVKLSTLLVSHSVSCREHEDVRFHECTNARHARHSYTIQRAKGPKRMCMTGGPKIEYTREPTHFGRTGSLPVWNLRTKFSLRRSAQKQGQSIALVFSYLALARVNSH